MRDIIRKLNKYYLKYDYIVLFDGIFYILFYIEDGGLTHVAHLSGKTLEELKQGIEQQINTTIL